MKKLLLFLLSLMLIVTMVACNGAKDPATTPDEETAPQSPADTNGGIRKETTAPETTSGKTSVINPEKYNISQETLDACAAYTIFKAPQGNPRDIVYDYMYKMSQVKWVATKGWNTHWKNQGDFGVNITYIEGKTYYGIPYSNTKCGLSVFEQYVVDGQFTYNSDYYEELIGNHCSSSMGLAYQQILDFPYTGGLRENDDRMGIIRLAGTLKTPPSRSTTSNWDFISANVTEVNGIEAMYEAYATLDKGDILYKMIDGSGHTRMVSKVEVNKTVAGKVLPSRSYVYCLEQTNAWADGKQESTWFIDRKYSFETLVSTNFTPYTFNIFHEENPVIYDAHIMLDKTNTADTLKKMMVGTVTSTFPINAVRATVTDASGNIVSEYLKYDFTKTYKVNFRDFTFKLNVAKLPAGTYTYTATVCIARGSWVAETLTFTIE